jgi:ABC-type lipoprotein export system ATPase subunit
MQQEQKKNGKLLPDDIRCLIIGSSGYGKTTLMNDNFLLSPG